jgi:hypothetical protein
LGSAHLPGFVQEAAVVDLRPCDFDPSRRVPKRPIGSDTLDVREKERFR